MVRQRGETSAKWQRSAERLEKLQKLAGGMLSLMMSKIVSVGSWGTGEGIVDSSSCVREGQCRFLSSLWDHTSAEGQLR